MDNNIIDDLINNALKDVYPELTKSREILMYLMSKQKRKEFNDEMVRKTWHYQKIYNFETSSEQGHEFWDVEADAFKHAFGSALFTYKYNYITGRGAGIYHELETKKNPRDEWNMDSWNNYQGQEIAMEI